MPIRVCARGLRILVDGLLANGTTTPCISDHPSGGDANARRDLSEAMQRAWSDALPWMIRAMSAYYRIPTPASRRKRPGASSAMSDRWRQRERLGSAVITPRFIPPAPMSCCGVWGGWRGRPAATCKRIVRRATGPCIRAGRYGSRMRLRWRGLDYCRGTRSRARQFPRRPRRRDDPSDRRRNCPLSFVERLLLRCRVPAARMLEQACAWA